MAVSKKVKALADKLSAKTPRVKPTPEDDYLSTGCTLLNLAFTGHPDRGVPKGGYLYWVGGSGAIKTWSAFTVFAEAARNVNFAGYRFVHDNPENGALMDVERYFGRGVVDRLVAPRYAKDKTPIHSNTAKEFYINLDSNCDKGPCIYALDSMDALNDDADDEVFEAEVKLYETGEGKVPGSMGMAKAKTNSKNINRVVKALRKNGSILVVISQTRDRVGTIPGQTRSGGRALKFFAHLEVWTSVKGPVTKTYMGKDREVGSYIQLDVQKNRVSGWEGKTTPVTFIKGYGIDDPGTLVNYLCDEGHWESSRTKAGVLTNVTAPEFAFDGKPEALIQLIQDSDREPELRQLAAKVWDAIVQGARPQRKQRYT